MVQLEPNLALTLKNLASQGAVLAAEQQVGEVVVHPPGVLLHSRTSDGIDVGRPMAAAKRPNAPPTCGALCRGVGGVGLWPARRPLLTHDAWVLSFLPTDAPVQAALDYSLTIKRVEAGLKTLVLWGKVTALNGKVGGVA